MPFVTFYLAIESSGDSAAQLSGENTEYAKSNQSERMITSETTFARADGACPHSSGSVPHLHV